MSQKLANAVWAIPTRYHASLAFFDAVAEVAKASSQEYFFQELANTVWTFPALGHTYLYNMCVFECAYIHNDEDDVCMH
eukprot:6877491-Karenia_brevis.AAC.1